MASSTLYLTSVGDTGALVCLAARDISESVARKTLAELQENVQASGVDLVASTEGSLTTPLKGILFSVLRKDVSGDKLAELHKKVRNIKGIMVTNVQKAYDNGKLLEEEVENSEALAREAKAFETASLELRHQMRMRALKLRCGAIGTVVCIVGYVVVGLMPDEWSSGLASDSSDVVGAINPMF